MKKKILSVLLCAVMVSSLLVGCGGKTDDTKPEETKKVAENDTKDSEYTVVVMPKLVGIPYFTQTGEGATKAGEELGVNVIYNGPTVGDAAEQVKMLEDYITQGVDAICVAPNDAAALDPVLKKAKEAGILILDWDTEATKDLVDASIHQIDDKELGEHLAIKMVEYMGVEEGEYAIVTGALSASNLNAWIQYAKAYMEEKYPNIKLVTDPIATDESQSVALSKTKDLLKAYPELDGIIAVSTPAPIGSAQAVAELGLQDKVSVVGTAVKEDIQEVLADGSLDLGALWNTQDLGYLTVAVAKSLLDGNKLTDGMEVEGFGSIAVNGEKDVIMGPPADYVKE
jgi:simple sugar transport system substrate-binding protein